MSISGRSTNVCLADEVLDELLESTSLEAAPSAVVGPSTTSFPTVEAAPSGQHSQQSMPKTHRQATAEGSIIAEAVQEVAGGRKPGDGATDADETATTPGKINSYTQWLKLAHTAQAIPMCVT